MKKDIENYSVEERAVLYQETFNELTKSNKENYKIKRKELNLWTKQQDNLLSATLQKITRGEKKEEILSHVRQKERELNKIEKLGK